MKISTDGYPAPLEFETEVALPPFEYGCKVRTKLLREKMREQKINSPRHAYDDYVVEVILQSTKYFEVWGIGS